MTHEEYKIIEDNVVAELHRLWKNSALLIEIEGSDYIERKENEIRIKYDLANLPMLPNAQYADLVEQIRSVFGMYTT
jgi:hypothetical protein